MLLNFQVFAPYPLSLFLTKWTACMHFHFTPTLVHLILFRGFLSVGRGGIPDLPFCYLIYNYLPLPSLRGIIPFFFLQLKQPYTDLAQSRSETDQNTTYFSGQNQRCNRSRSLTYVVITMIATVWCARCACMTSEGKQAICSTFFSLWSLRWGCSVVQPVSQSVLCSVQAR